MTGGDGLGRRRTPGLGRGLSALLGEVEREQPVRDGGASDGVQRLPVADISPDPAQPRRHFDEELLDELGRSIAARGMLQPILVRPDGAGGYRIIAGERRWRAAQRARLHEVPVIVRAMDDAGAFELAIVENIQRADLNAIEEAEAYARLVRDYQHSPDDIGRLVNKSRSHVANLMRLLDLPEPVRDAVARGTLSMGHARALITAPDAETLAREVIRRDLSVRETERLARAVRPEARASGRGGGGTARAIDADIVALERQLGDMLGLKVVIAHAPSGGTVSLGYASLDQLDMICQRLSGEAI